MLEVARAYQFFQDKFRPRRMRRFVTDFGLSNNHSILDIGGAPRIWSYISVTPQVTIGNITEIDRAHGRFDFRQLDGTKLPYRDLSFDIAFSNSVIEHVGGWQEQSKFAAEVRRVARYYYVQTPNRWFFVEPHFISIGVHYLPQRIFRKLLPYFSLWFWIERPSQEKVDEWVGEIRLLTESEMRVLFPDAEIVKEKFLGFTKSIIAMRLPREY